MDRTKKFLAIIILVLVGIVGWEGHVLASPAPTTNLVCEPGGCTTTNVCTDNLWADGTTPIDTRNHASQIVGTAGQDWGAFLNTNIVANSRACFGLGSFGFSTTWNVPANVGIFGSTVQYVSPVTGTVFKLNAATTLLNSTGPSSATHNVGFQLQNVYVDGGNNAAKAIFLKFDSNIIIQNINIINIGDSALYLDSIFNGFINNMKIDNCGASGILKSCIYMGGTQAVSDLDVSNIAMSTMNGVGLSIDANTADVKISNWDDDENAVVASATNVQIQLVAGSQRIYFSNVDMRTIASSISMVNDQSTTSFWSTVWMGNGLGVAFNRGGAGTTSISGIHIEGVGSGANRMGNGLYAPLGTIIATGYSTTNVITPFFTNAGAGVLDVSGITPIPATSTITACASVCTVTNTDGYTQNYFLSNLNGGTVSAWTCNGVSGWPTTVSSTGCLLSDSQSMTVTWATTAPTFTKVPYG